MAKIIAPVVTIFNEEEKPDYAGNKKVIDFLIEGGLDGILVLGSAGEFPDLNEQERLDFFRFYAEYVNGRETHEQRVLAPAGDEIRDVQLYALAVFYERAQERIHLVAVALQRYLRLEAALVHVAQAIAYMGHDVETAHASKLY